MSLYICNSFSNLYKLIIAELSLQNLYILSNGFLSSFFGDNSRLRLRHMQPPDAEFLPDDACQAARCENDWMPGYQRNSTVRSHYLIIDKNQ